MGARQDYKDVFFFIRRMIIIVFFIHLNNDQVALQLHPAGVLYLTARYTTLREAYNRNLTADIQPVVVVFVFIIIVVVIVVFIVVVPHNELILLLLL